MATGSLDTVVTSIFPSCSRLKLFNCLSAGWIGWAVTIRVNKNSEAVSVLARLGQLVSELRANL
jgi:hypothetical protein